MAPPPPPLVLLHGFTQTGASWQPVLDSLRWSAPVRCPDLPGHGDRSDRPADLAESAAALLPEVTAATRPILVGYSMGGRLALRIALDFPEALAGLVLVGATAGIDDRTARRERRRADERLATEIERDGVDAFLDRWLSQPLFADLVVRPDDLAARRSNTASGLAGALRLAGTGTMDPPWWDQLGRLAVTTLVVWGERDAKFTRLGGRLAEAIGPDATTASIPGAGHAAHLEDPDRFAALLGAFAEGLVRE